ncbi:MAG: hypothetical protein LC689_12790 [Myxococcales bacterium]|nr:hypothetical protein [Myxococcales bacterium]
MRIACAIALCGLACASPVAAPPAERASPPPPPAAPPSIDGGVSEAPADAGTVVQPGWQVISREDFESSSLPQAAWSPDPVPDDGPFADDGAFFKAQGVVPPKAYRISAPAAG